MAVSLLPSSSCRSGLRFTGSAETGVCPAGDAHQQLTRLRAAEYHGSVHNPPAASSAFALQLAG